MQFIVVTDLLILTSILKQWSVSNRSLYSAENLGYLRKWKSEKPRKTKVRSHNKVRYCVKVRALSVKNKVRSARAEQLWYKQ